MSVAQTNVGLLAGRPGSFEALSWYAVRTRPRFEKKTVSDLKQKGIETFLPLSATKRQWSDRQSLVYLPIFPGYVFVRIAASLANRVMVLRTNGVLNFVGPRDMGVSIPDEEIESVRTVVKRNLAFEPYPYLRRGNKVCIRGGALDGMEGILVGRNGNTSLVISIDPIHRSLTIRIDGYSVAPA